MTSKEIPVSALHLMKRNQIAKKTIEHYVLRDAVKNIALGFTGGLIPGAAIPAIVASFALQATAIYQPMANHLADIYLSQPDSFIRKQIRVGMGVNAVGESGIYAVEIGVEIVCEMISELLPETFAEAGLVIICSVLPGFSTVAGMVVGGLLAKKLTSKVGALMVLYYQNNSEWVGGDKKKTLIVLNALLREKLNFDRFPIQVPEIGEKHVAGAMQQIEGFEQIDPQIGPEKIKTALHGLGYQDETINRAVDRVVLRRNMTSRFNVQEIMGICFDLNIDHEQFNGEGKDSLIRELILFCGRIGQLPALLSTCKRLRPSMQW